MNPQGMDMVGLIWSKQEQQLPSIEERNEAHSPVSNYGLCQGLTKSNEKQEGILPLDW